MLCLVEGNLLNKVFSEGDGLYLIGRILNTVGSMEGNLTMVTLTTFLIVGFDGCMSVLHLEASKRFSLKPDCFTTQQAVGCHRFKLQDERAFEPRGQVEKKVAPAPCCRALSKSKDAIAERSKASLSFF